MRIVKEFFNPKLKCKRLGHLKKVETKKIRKECEWWRRAIAEDYSCKINICERCGKVLSVPYDLKYLGYWTSITMSSERMREMEENGYIFID